MEVAAAAATGRRPPYPGAPFELSVLTLTVNATNGPEDGAGTVGLLRRAREAGITTFDTVDSPDDTLAEAWIARAFPWGDPSIVVLARGGAEGAKSAASRALARGAPVAAFSEAGPPRREGAPSYRFRHLYEVDASDPGPTVPHPVAQGPPTGAGPAEPVVLRCRSLEEIVEASHRPPPRVLSGSYSLLEQALAATAEEVIGTGGFAWVARDPLAGGRLDGSRFASGSMGAGAAGPRTLRELEVDFEAVARLGFLAKPRRRTLAQAALHFVLGQPWVATACLPIPTAERWAEIVGFGSSPPLDEGERARVEALPGRPTATPAHGGPRR
jgi:aryl-alcohol dehydrogenase-like predicted oxidoreductase